MKINLANIKKAQNLLNKKECVAIPTETVYGLAGNAYSDQACKKIFKLKKRPKYNPLIVHYYNYKKMKKDCNFNDNFLKLYKRFCPGPITFVLKKKKKSKIKSSVTAGLNTVAIRFPSHRIVRSILKKINFPLAMPSANLSTNISPVNAWDVADEFRKNIKLIINGGKSKIGIESTVIDLTANPKILRPGIIGPEIINRILKISIVKKNLKIKSPGMLKKHYSPGIPVLLNQKKSDNKSAFIYLGVKFKNNKKFFSLSKNSNLKEAASNLYKTFRLIKKKGFKKIQIAKIPFIGSGIAINDRIKRAASNK